MSRVFPVLTFSTVDWHDVWQRPQALMSRLAGDGCAVLYVDTLGLRSPRPRDLARILARLRNALASSNGALREPVPGVRVLSPLLLPFLDSRLARRANVRRLVPRLRRHLEMLGRGDPVVWIYLPTRTVLDCVKALPRRLLVYESIDALASNPAGVSRDFDVAEREILTSANLVLTSSETLQRKKAAWNANTHWVPPGVGDEFFAPHTTPREIADLPAPRVGFFGTIDHRLDLDVMRRLAETYRGWSFVLIGPARVDLGALTALPNVHWLGPKKHAELPGYVAALDAVVLPYVTDEFTRHIHPAKIHECLAVGLPVVATRLPSLEPLQGLIRLVRPGQSFGEELESSLREDDEELRSRRVEAARASSWNVRYAQIRQLLDEALASRDR